MKQVGGLKLNVSILLWIFVGSILIHCRSSFLQSETNSFGLMTSTCLKHLHMWTDLPGVALFLPLSRPLLKLIQLQLKQIWMPFLEIPLRSKANAYGPWAPLYYSYYSWRSWVAVWSTSTSMLLVAPIFLKGSFWNVLENVKTICKLAMRYKSLQHCDALCLNDMAVSCTPWSCRRLSGPLGIAVIGDVPRGFPSLSWPIQSRPSSSTSDFAFNEKVWLIDFCTDAEILTPFQPSLPATFPLQAKIGSWLGNFCQEGGWVQHEIQWTIRQESIQHNTTHEIQV